jgi:Na+/melibiose symporter-like transporter
MITLIAMWMMFKKAGEPGWAAIIPFYNMYILFKIATGKGTKFLWLLVPVAGMIILASSLSDVFGKSKGFKIGLFFLTPIFIWILGFGKATYNKPAIDVTATQETIIKDEGTV